MSEANTAAVNPASETAAPIPPSTLRSGTMDRSQALQIVRQHRQFHENQAVPEDEGKTNPETDQAPKPVERPEAKPAQAAEQEAEESEAESTAEPENEPETPPELSEFTIEELASALEIDPEQLGSKLKVKVKVDGEVHEVNLADAIKGHQFETDYRQKTAKLAEERHAFEQSAQQAGDQLRARFQLADDLISILQAKVQTGPDPQQMNWLRENNMPEYMRVKEQFESDQQALQQALQARHQDRSRSEQEAQGNRARWRSQQVNELMAMPDFSTPDKVVKFENEARPALKAFYGFNDKQIDNFFANYEARQVPIVLDAIRYRQMQKEAGNLKKVIASKPKFAPPGPSKTSHGKKEDAIGALRTRLGQAKGKADQKTAALALIRAKRER